MFEGEGTEALPFFLIMNLYPIVVSFLNILLSKTIYSFPSVFYTIELFMKLIPIVQKFSVEEVVSFLAHQTDRQTRAPDIKAPQMINCFSFNKCWQHFISLVYPPTPFLLFVKTADTGFLDDRGDLSTFSTELIQNKIQAEWRIC